MPYEAIGHQLWGPLAIRTCKSSLKKMKHWTCKVLCFVSLGWKCGSVGECLPDGIKLQASALAIHEAAMRLEDN